MSNLVQRIHDEVDLGVILNLDWRTWHNWTVGKYDANCLAAGGTLPDDHEPSQEYSGDKYITCTPLRTVVSQGEELHIKALIMGEVNQADLHYRPLGQTSFTSLELNHDARGVYRAVIPGQVDDFEWYVTARTSLGDVIFPASAGAEEQERMYQTVAVWQ